MNKCRVCGSDFFAEPILKYKNMPKAAQFLPDESDLPNEKGVALELCQCKGCGVVQLSNEPVSYYKEVIRAAAFSEEMKAFRISQFGHFLKEYGLSSKKVIEIGCGHGEYLEIMQESGAKAYGIEAAKDAVLECKKKGLNVEKEFIESSDYKLKDAPFDAFFIMNFLEHLPDINDTLQGICNNLKDDAVGLIEVPNFDMMLQKNLFSEFINDHLFYFTKDTLTRTLSLNGFEVVSCEQIWHDYIISAVVKKRKRLDIEHFYKYQEKLKRDLHSYINSFEKVAVWGAGHQALAVFSLADLADKIRYVVDSATFKQGKYTPATHIPIVEPAMLVKEPVDAIIIMAASYSDEVARIVQTGTKFDKNIKLAILRDFGLEIL